MKLAEGNGIRLGMESKNLVVEKFKPKTTYLMPEEVKALKKYFSNEYLNPSHRLPLAYFLTSCYTGMRISDIQAVKNELGENVTSFNQVKTDNFQFIKLNQEIRTIEKVPEFFTESLSDQRINKHLKIIGPLCKIEKA